MRLLVVIVSLLCGSCSQTAYDADCVQWGECREAFCETVTSETNCETSRCDLPSAQELKGTDCFVVECKQSDVQSVDCFCDAVADCPKGSDLPDASCQGACGDGKCLGAENADTCPVDCGPCGDGICGHHEAGPAGGSCPGDCLAACGNGVCQGGESPQFCLVDCSGCGDGFCGFEESPELCLVDCPPTCGDGDCDPGEGILVCPVDCYPPCGDGLCSGGENPYNCPLDCTVCGDRVCGTDETLDNCATDCVTPCGNGLCDGQESDVSCPVDCGPCGDSICGLSESLESCPVDCHACSGKECGEDGFGGLCGICDDGDPCTVDLCVDHQCNHEVPPQLCDDGNECTEDACVPDFGCEHTPLPGASCDDGNPCTIGGVCADTVCQGLAWNSCNDGDDCTDDSCVPPGGCQNEISPDGTPCGLVPGDVCFNAVCCSPDCAGKACGSDGCGGSCGTCPAQSVCASGACFSTVCGGCSLDEQFESWDDLVWEGNQWCNDIDEGAWQPTMGASEATLAGADDCWTQLRTITTWGAYQGMRVFVHPNLQSGGGAELMKLTSSMEMAG